MSSSRQPETALQNEIQQLRARIAILESDLQVPKEIVEKAPVMISIVRAPDFIYETVNPAFQALAPGKQFLGRRFADVWSEITEPLIDILRNVIATGETFHLEDAPYTIQRGPGTPPEVVYVTYSWIPLFNSEGKADRVLTLAHEVTESVRQRQQLAESITELKRAEGENQRLLTAVHEEKDRLSAVIASMSDEVWFADVHKHFTLANPSAVREFSLIDGDDIDVEKFASSLEVYRPDGSPRPVEEAPPLRALNGESIRNQDEIVRTPATGQLRYRQISSAPVKDASGEIIGSVSVVRDITERKQAEKALRDRENVLSTFFESPGVMRGLVELVDGAIRHISCNSAAAEMYGIDANSIRGKTAAEAGASEENVMAWIELYEQSRRTGGYVSGEYARRDAGGNERWLLATAAYLGDGPSGNPQFAYTIIDVTDRKRAEEALRQSHERLEKVLDNQAVGVMFWDLNTGCMFDANDTFLDFMGYSRGEVEARELTWQRLTPPEYVDLSLAEIERFQATGRIGPYEKEYLHKDGTRQWLLFAGSSLGNNQCVEFCVDISLRKRAEAALRESEERLRSLGDNLPDSVVYQYVHELDGSSRFLYCSGGIERINGVMPADVLRDARALQGQIPSEYMERLVHEELRSKRNLSDFNIEVPMRRPDGEMRWMRLQARPRRLADGRTIWDGVETDITEQKKAEDRLRQSQKLESVGLLAGGVAHDFNNLLTGVMGNASLLLEDAAPEQADVLRSIIASTERAAHLTRQLLAYSGKGQFIVRDMDVTQAVNEMADLVQFSIPKSVSLALNLERRLPFVAMDPGQLQQILMNLVINAGEAIGDSNPGRITVTTSMTDLRSPFTDELGVELAAGRYVCIEVHDTGSGIDPEKKAKIFDPFFSTKFVGRGLGLAAIAGILRSQKGGVTVESEPGKGSKFTVFLPAAARAGVAIPEPGFQEGRPTVLVVDDEVAVRDFITAVLRKRGYHVIQASDGQQALDVCGSAPGAIGAAIVDVIMPNLSANDLLPALKAKQPGMRILLTSGYSEAEARRLCAAYPNAAFIQKPYTAQQIARAVDELAGASAS